MPLQMEALIARYVNDRAWAASVVTQAYCGVSHRHIHEISYRTGNMRLIPVVVIDIIECDQCAAAANWRHPSALSLGAVVFRRVKKKIGDMSMVYHTDSVLHYSCLSGAIRCHHRHASNSAAPTPPVPTERYRCYRLWWWRRRNDTDAAAAASHGTALTREERKAISACYRALFHAALEQSCVTIVEQARLMCR